ncbi:MAG: hypothetical protein HZC55_03690 [Verrucomicrobia bacterium]|nr:hypothetical protein [Verrucomicrobiota bacterium]
MNSPQAEGVATSWMRRIHILLGLYFFFALWLFALTGLLLNHAWGFAEFWSKRRVETTEVAVVAPPPGSPLEQARHLLHQLRLTGEVHWLVTPADATRLDFRVQRPGRQVEVKADLRAGRVVLQTTTVNGWGVSRALHTFSGVRANDSLNDRDWWLTSLWVWTMDALSLGIIALVGTGIVSWLLRSRLRWQGGIALGSGLVLCAWFALGLQWFSP